MAEKHTDTIGANYSEKPPTYDEKVKDGPETVLVDDTARRSSVALNIVENPLQVSSVLNSSTAAPRH